MRKQRLDQLLVRQGLAPTRSQAGSWIRLGKVNVNGRPVTKPGEFVSIDADLKLAAPERYVSRAGLKLASVAQALQLDFKNKLVLDVGSSTGGFTDYALQHGARRVIAIDVGTEQLHPSLRGNPNIQLFEQTDIRQVGLRTDRRATNATVSIENAPDIVLIDVSFVSLRHILPHIIMLCKPHSQVVAMVKPQFEALAAHLKHKGVIKNDRLRRDILKQFEAWATHYFIIAKKSDSGVAGAKGNRERFYLLLPLK